MSGKAEEIREAKEYMRNGDSDFSFEPQVVHEVKDVQKQREKQLVQNGILIKPKGVDIALAVHMIEHAPNYDNVIMATSDADYLPVIHAVRRMGKNVYVLGFENGIAKDSDFFHVVERFRFIADDWLNERFYFK